MAMPGEGAANNFMEVIMKKLLIAKLMIVGLGCMALQACVNAASSHLPGEELPQSWTNKVVKPCKDDKKRTHGEAFDEVEHESVKEFVQDRLASPDAFGVLDGYGGNVLLYSADQDDTELLEMVLASPSFEKKFLYEKVDHMGRNVLYYAMKSNNVACFNRCLQEIGRADFSQEILKKLFLSKSKTPIGDAFRDLSLLDFIACSCGAVAEKFDAYMNVLSDQAQCELLLGHAVQSLDASFEYSLDVAEEIFRCLCRAILKNTAMATPLKAKALRVLYVLLCVRKESASTKAHFANIETDAVQYFFWNIGNPESPVSVDEKIVLRDCLNQLKAVALQLLERSSEVTMEQLLRINYE